MSRMRRPWSMSLAPALRATSAAAAGSTATPAAVAGAGCRCRGAGSAGAAPCARVRCARHTSSAPAVRPWSSHTRADRARHESPPLGAHSSPTTQASGGTAPGRPAAAAGPPPDLAADAA
eukprot:228128-Chlamydomonas_euryale.AAC.1